MSSHSPVSVRTYVIIYVTLLLLTLLTATLSQAAHLGAWEVPVALGIAGVKTALVAAFFMHLIQAGKLVWLILGAGVFFLVVMLALTFSDYATRGFLPGWPG
jgi:cytochrome c oxidase subunit 4